MGQRAAVFCHNGLGDGVNSLVLSNNLQLNGWKVVTYHNLMESMGNWFPHLEVRPYPSMEGLAQVLQAYDYFFVVHNDTDEWTRKLVQEGKRRFPEKVKVLYLYPSSNIVNEPYYSDCQTDPGRSVAENMRLFCEKILHLPKLTRSNGFIPLPGLILKKWPKRVVIHPTSAKVSRNWPRDKFVKLAQDLKLLGYEPVFVPGGKEKTEWEGVGCDVAIFPTLDALARFIYESGYHIGNDSGLGHLASALGISTLTICRRKAWANMWAPSFHKGVVVTPSSWIPNIRGFRLRDRLWQKFISVKKVKSAFEQLVQIAS